MQITKPPPRCGCWLMLRVLADAADVVGVKYFDTDTMDPEVEDLQAATSAARALLNP